MWRQYDGYVRMLRRTCAGGTDTGGETVDPVSGNAKQFLLSGIGDTYTVTATKTGYTTEAKQVKNTGDQTFTIVMKATT